MAKAKARQQVRIIKEQQRQAPVEKADTSVQLSEQEVYNAGDWITPPNDLFLRSDFFAKISKRSGAGNGSGERVRLLRKQKRPDGYIPFGRIRYGIQLEYDKFRICCQGVPVPYSEFF